MATIIQFPQKQPFLDQFKGKVPDDILSELSTSFDNALALLKCAPTVEFVVSKNDKPSAEKFKLENHRYLLKLFQRILKLEVELILARRGL